MLTTDVENYPGFPDGIVGPDLMAKFREQAERFGAEFVTADVDEVDFSAHAAARAGRRPRRARARSVIISTGAQARMLGLPNEHDLLGHGVSTCATCDGFFFRGHDIAVVGGGDSALEEANFLTKFADKVTLVHRRKELRASKIMQDRAFANPKIEFLWNSVGHRRERRRPGRGARAARHRDRRRRASSPVTGLFVAIGHDPNTKLFVGQLELDDGGYIVTQARLDGDLGPRACSRPATCRTTSTGRRSPRPAPDVWRRSRPSATSRPSPTYPRRSSRERYPCV